MSSRGFLLPEAPIPSAEEYVARGGGAGLRRAAALGSEATIEQVRASGLRGRGGAGFPTGVKWKGARQARGAPRYLVCNAAEGEPGTFKDRWLIRSNPYQLLEGIAIASSAIGAEEAFIGIKGKSAVEIAALQRAAAEMSAAGIITGVTITIVPGPDDYLFGEEKALLEVVEGNDPLPRLHPPYVQGLFEGATGDLRPTVVNNVETLCNVPHILANGPEWFRSLGTPRSPGTMVFTIGGDVRRDAVVELELGTPLSQLVVGVGGGTASGRRILLIANGVSNRPLTRSELDLPMDFESLRAAGSGLGSGGFTVYDDTACPVRVAEALSSFLNGGSCGQCPPCKLGTGEIAGSFARLGVGGSGAGEIEEIAAWCQRVTDSNRCGLGAAQQALAGGFLTHFSEHLAAHAAGEPCGSRRVVTAPVIEDRDPATGRFRYAGPQV